jgi:transcriptional regulator with XRE-family HTH domain
VTFRSVLVTELHRRRAVNRRYSLRSFARDLSLHHSTLSQMLRGRRRLTGRTVRALGPRLRLTPDTVAELCALENEAAVLSVLARSNFQANSRWVSAMVGIPVDEVNVALQRLLRQRAMTMITPTQWQRVKIQEG